MSVWRDRIVGYDEVDPAELTAHEANWRVHGLFQREALLGVLQSIGLVQNVLVNRRTGRLLDGHLRVALAREQGQPRLRVTYVDVDDAEERLILATLDPLAALAEVDDARLTALLDGLASEESALNALLDDLRGQHRPSDDAPDYSQAPAKPEQAAALQQAWQTAAGQLWVVPSRTVSGATHRLLCADSRQATAVASCLDGARPRLEFSDPPYQIIAGGGGVQGKRRYLGDIKAGRLHEFDPTGLTPLSGTAVFCCNRPLIPAYLALAASWGGDWDLGVYVKTNPIPNWHGHLMTDLEYLVILGAQAPEPGLAKALYSKAYIEDGKEDRLVTWAKPLGLVQKFVSLYSRPGDVVIDRFGGSGTTLVACEALGRVGYALDDDPTVLAVSLQRLHDLGLTPTLEGRR